MYAGFNPFNSRRNPPPQLLRWVLHRTIIRKFRDEDDDEEDEEVTEEKVSLR